MITITRRRRKRNAKFEKAVSNAKGIGAKKVADFRKVLKKLNGRDDRLKAATIRAFARKHGLELQHHKEPWIFRSQKGPVQIAMPAGYYAVVVGVLEKIVVRSE